MAGNGAFVPPRILGLVLDDVSGGARLKPEIRVGSGNQKKSRMDKNR